MEFLTKIAVVLFIWSMIQAMMKCNPLVLFKTQKDCQDICTFIKGIEHNINIKIAEVRNTEEAFEALINKSKCQNGMYKSCHRFKQTYPTSTKNIFESIHILKENVENLLPYSPSKNILQSFFIYLTDVTRFGEKCIAQKHKTYVTTHTSNTTECCNDVTIKYYAFYSQVESMLFDAKSALMKEMEAKKCYGS